jgi:hypothetical protein
MAFHDAGFALGIFGAGNQEHGILQCKAIFQAQHRRALQQSRASIKVDAGYLNISTRLARQLLYVHMKCIMIDLTYFYPNP